MPKSIKTVVQKRSKTRHRFLSLFGSILAPKWHPKVRVVAPFCLPKALQKRFVPRSRFLLYFGSTFGQPWEVGVATPTSYGHFWLLSGLLLATFGSKIEQNQAKIVRRIPKGGPNDARCPILCHRIGPREPKPSCAKNMARISAENKCRSTAACPVSSAILPPQCACTLPITPRAKTGGGGAPPAGGLRLNNPKWSPW